MWNVWRNTSKVYGINGSRHYKHRYSKGTKLAIAEWPTYSKEKGDGAIDYALFIGEN